MKRIRIFDTTLRDGEQGIGNLMGIDQKQQNLLDIDRLGVDKIELGFPAASSEDCRWIQLASTLSLKAKPVLFSRLKVTDVALTVDLAALFQEVEIELLGVGSEWHVEKKRQITLSQAYQELKEAVILAQQSQKTVSVIFEDATRGSSYYLKKSVDIALAAGATTIALADTVGFAVPDQIRTLIEELKTHINDDRITLSIHCHNDLGLATANTLAAIQAGVDEIQTTVGGIGERAGNCALEEVVAVLLYKPEIYDAYVSIDTRQIVTACEQLFARLKKTISSNKPIVGEHVFATAAGIHQSGLMKEPRNYEYIEPEQFGRQREMFFNRLSGKSLLRKLLVGLTEESIDAFYDFLLQKNKIFSEQEILAYYQYFYNQPVKEK